jgi:hypothetical protein
MQFMVVITTQRHRKFIADLASQRLGLRKFEVMCVTGNALAYDTRLRPDEQQMGFAPFANGLGADRDDRWSGLYRGKWLL